MAIPIAYNLRNLVVRKTTTVMTAIGIGLTVAVLVADLALVEGLKTAFKATGHPLQLVVMRKGSNAEMSSTVTREAFQTLKAEPRLAVNEAREPLASPEILTVINLPSVDSPAGMNLTVRAMSQVGVEMRGAKIQPGGRWFQSGQREIVVGKSVVKRYPNAQPGKRLRFGRGEWEVVGVFDAGDSAFNGEIWGDLNQVGADYNRQDTFSSVLVRAGDAATLQALTNSLNDDQRLGVTVVREREYYEQQTASGAPLQFFGLLVAVIMAVGSSFAAMNTMYAAVARRAKEIGTLRVLGFSRGSILLSFLIESLLLAFIGGVLGCLLALPINGVTTGVGNFATFSEVAFDFRVSPSTMLAGIIFALVVGAIGGLFPAGSAARKEILTALREI
jgi:ABC-type antimicrobial peptide transport system permease subunit